MVTKMRQHKWTVMTSLGGGILSTTLILLGILVFGQGACCSPPPSEAQDHPIVLTGKLVFESDPTDFNGHFVSIATLNADGTEYQKLTNYFGDGELEGFRVDSPAWSHDGRQIAFVAFKTDAPSRLYTMNADGSNLTLIGESDSGTFSGPSWSPNGDRIVYAFNDNNDHELYIIDLLTDEITQITDNNATDASPAWTPFGEWIAFNSDRDGDFELFVMRADGSEIVQMTDNNADDRYPTWSPEGSELAFVSDRDGNDAIYRMSIADMEAQRVLNKSLVLSMRLAWSPDGEYIAYTAPMPMTADISDTDIITHPATGLWVVRITDGKSVPIAYSFGGWNASPSWVR